LKKIFAVLAVAFTVTALLSLSVFASDNVTHPNYINGSSDGFFHPNDTLSRAEVAQMIYNIRDTFPRLKQTDTTSSYADVRGDAWYAAAVSLLSSNGMLSGYSDGTFRPNKAVTRAEFVQLLASLSGERIAGVNTSFSDISETHWAYSAVVLAETKGWIHGSYGRFRPDDSMTRAEAVTALNAFLGREADCAAVDANRTVRYFPDVMPDDWYYYAVMEASVSHEATLSQNGEKWTGVVRYYSVLPDGFYSLGGEIRFLEDGVFTDVTEDGVTVSFSYTALEDGSVLPEDGCYVFPGGNDVIVCRGEIASEDGLYVLADGLYCIENGTLLKDGEYMGLSFSSDGRYTSGNETIDAFVDGIVREVYSAEYDDVELLRAVYDYVYSHTSYRANNNHVPRGAEAAEWTEEHILRLIDTGKGNCYCYAAEMYYLCRRIGWTSVTAVSGGVTPDDLDHGWVTVEYEGETRMLDPELDKSSGPYPGSCFLVTYSNAPFSYYSDSERLY